MPDDGGDGVYCVKLIHLSLCGLVAVVVLVVLDVEGVENGDGEMEPGEGGCRCSKRHVYLDGNRMREWVSVILGYEVGKEVVVAGRVDGPRPCFQFVVLEEGSRLAVVGVGFDFPCNLCTWCL